MADLSYQSLINSLMMPQPSDQGLYQSLMKSLSSSDFRRADNIEDRRDDPNPNEPKWENVLPSLKEMAMRGGAYLGIPGTDTPMADEVPPTELSKAAGYDQIKIEKEVPGRSLLDRAIDDVQDGISIFRKPGEKLGSDVPFTQRSFSKGYF